MDQTSVPARVTRPSVGASRPVASRFIVVFPLPVRPIRPRLWPAGISTSTPCRTVWRSGPSAVLDRDARGKRARVGDSGNEASPRGRSPRCRASRRPTRCMPPRRLLHLLQLLDHLLERMLEDLGVLEHQERRPQCDPAGPEGERPGHQGDDGTSDDRAGGGVPQAEQGTVRGRSSTSARRAASRWNRANA